MNDPMSDKRSYHASGRERVQQAAVAWARIGHSDRVVTIPEARTLLWEVAAEHGNVTLIHRQLYDEAGDRTERLPHGYRNLKGIDPVTLADDIAIAEQLADQHPTIPVLLEHLAERLAVNVGLAAQNAQLRQQIAGDQPEQATREQVCTIELHYKPPGDEVSRATTFVVPVDGTPLLARVHRAQVVG